MRVKKGYEPLCVRGGAWNAKLDFNLEEGKAEWLDAKKEYVMKHSGDKLSWLNDQILKEWQDKEKEKQE
eukprot:5875687-Karenia_brevis.AAC.1